MEKKIIKLSETEFREMISESVKYVLDEIGYRSAALPHGANYNAAKSKIQNRDKNAISKMDASNQKRMEAITLSIHDNFPHLELNFIERDKANQYYSVVFLFNQMMTLNDERFVMKGDINISGHGNQQGYIEFNFQKQSFYRVHFYGNGGIRRIYSLMLDNDYIDTFKAILSFITNICYSEKDYENNIDINGATLSKKH
ncbi:MAG: hypothetical protein HUJ61_05930 [Bacilli bacterium]|nr:hypothetical protein [Bacilli bacterium]